MTRSRRPSRSAKAANVIETGLAGFQRQMRLEATGQMGDDDLPGACATRASRRRSRTPVNRSSMRARSSSSSRPRTPPPATADEDVRARDRATTASGCIDERPGLALRASSGDGLARPRAARPAATSDCSEHATAAYYWAGSRPASPFPTRTPRLGRLRLHRHADRQPARLELLSRSATSRSTGDSESSTEHVCTCYVAGGESSSKWCSHGSEEAPYSVALRYRSDLICVVRPAQVP